MPKTVTAANQAPLVAAEDTAAGVGLIVANQYASPGKDNWVQLSPFGKFPNAVGLQVFTPADAQEIANEFDSLPSVGVKAIGLPWYVGHPDHPDFKQIYTDAAAKGRIKELSVRQSPGCPKCRAFTSAVNSRAAMLEGINPCAEHGLFGNVRWNDEGKHLIANEAFHGHSTNWHMKKVGGEWHPFSLKSVGFTNEPGIPVPTVTTANERKESMAKGPTLMDYVSKLLKKPELADAKNDAADGDAVTGMNEYVAAHDKLAADHEKLKGEHEKLKGDHTALETKHANLTNTMAGIAKCYGANEAVDAAVTAATKAGVTVPEADRMVWATNELVTRQAAVAAANEKISELTTQAANERKAGAELLGQVLLRGGFVTKAELETLTKDKDFSSADTVKAFVAAVNELKPKLNMVSQLPGGLGHMSASVKADADKKLASQNRVQQITAAVNEYQDEQQQKTGKRPEYLQAFNHVQRTKKELFTDTTETITR